MMGSGKTTIGKVLSENLRFHFEDLDKTIESIFKLSTNEIFLKYGEKEFRNDNLSRKKSYWTLEKCK